MRYLCGCEADPETAVYDAVDFRACPTHGQREQGWRTVEQHEPPVESEAHAARRRAEAASVMPAREAATAPDPPLAAQQMTYDELRDRGIE